MAGNYSQSIYEYDKILKSNMKRLGVSEKEFTFERDLKHGGLVQFYFQGVHWQYERTKEMMAQHGIALKDGKEAWAQLVIGLRDLVRLYERRIFDFTAGRVVGLKELPAPLSIPEYFAFMEFSSIPVGLSEVKDRFRELVKRWDPNNKATGSEEKYKLLIENKDRAMQHFDGD